MGARVFCVASARGGAGKTTLVAAFGVFLASLGKRVLLVDADPATRGLSLLYARTAEQSVVPLRAGLDLLPAPDTEVRVEDHRAALLRCVDRHRAGYDYIFLDAQAGVGEFTQAAIDPGVSDEVIIVSEHDPASAAGVERLRALCPGEPGRTRVLLNKAPQEARDLPEHLGQVPWTADVVRAHARRELALDLQEGNEFTVAVARTLSALLESDEPARWLDEHPREVQDVDRELDARRRERTRLLRVGVVRSVAVFVVSFVLALALSLAVAAPGTWLRVTGYVGFAVLLVLAFATRRFLVMRDALEENDRAITELESRRARPVEPENGPEA